MNKIKDKIIGFMRQKRKGTGATGYVCLFLIMLIMVILTMYMIQVAKLMTHQHHIDDSLTDSVLASLVADDTYYFETYEETGTPVIRLRSTDNSFEIFMDCMTDAVADMENYYYNFTFDTFICYEVEGNVVTISTYSGTSQVEQVSYGQVGVVKTPTDEVVTETSAYGKVQFDIENIIDKSYITKTKDIYCTLKINE